MIPAWCTRAVMATMAALALAAPASAAPGDGRLGGAITADKASTACPAGVGATGVSGNLSTIGINPVVGTITMRCRGGAAANGRMGTFSGAPGPGGSGCDAGEVVIGVLGREGDVRDQLSVRCRASDLTGTITSAA